MTEIGNRLKEARLEKGMSLDELQTATKIQKRYLQGIEDGNYNMMPGPFYVRAFIKHYAEAVGLDPDALFEEYKSEIPNTFNDDLPEKISRVQTRKNISGSSSKFFDILPKVLVVAFVIGALAVIWYFYSKNADEQSNSPVDKNNEETSYEQKENLVKEDVVEEKPADDETVDEETTEGETGTEGTTEEEPEIPAQDIAVVESKGKNTVYELKNAEKFEVKLVSTGETWVNMKNSNGKSLFQGMLKKGSAEESHLVDYTNETEAVLKIGNAVNTEIYVNDVKLEYAAAPTDHVTQDITIRFTKVAQ
ncbi:helix-turn-helix domain-containing protein [Robertmurraya kyonggiensis]|uniref:Helix-turn-helix domain-containing protein n=1 Tax=Robertmurraya kyonggiensis TaxID=1037680 RepID=A0A4U1DB78_9BACI|nr:helix-turn-helix domain-containing protein [Robertmurraya kyonggiensis]TKC18726.1 helix-turn-helix domain-containing protein [Robertmurraya kyonggiensis]